jgi:hypothetical protein
MLVNLCAKCGHWLDSTRQCSKYGDIFSVTRGCSLNLVEGIIRWDMRGCLESISYYQQAAIETH